MRGRPHRPGPAKLLPRRARWLRDKAQWKTSNFKKNFRLCHAFFFLKCFGKWCSNCKNRVVKRAYSNRNHLELALSQRVGWFWGLREPCDRGVLWPPNNPLIWRMGALAQEPTLGSPGTKPCSAVQEGTGDRQFPTGSRCGGVSRKSALTETKVKQRPVSRSAGRTLPAGRFSDVAHRDVAAVWRSPRGAFTVRRYTPGHGSSVRCCNKLKKN